jgi:DNA-binding NtrC family response regulator
MAKRVLIVEDSEDFRLLIQEIVEAMGHEVVVAERATEAWRVMQKSPVSLVLLDIKMPKIKGHAFLKYIREKGLQVPVIVVSGYLNPGVMEVLLEYRVRQVISKPFKIQRLTREISQILD